MIARGDTGQLTNGRDSYVLRFDEKSGYEGFIDVPCKTSFFKVYHYNAGVDAGGNPVPEKWIITPAPTTCDYNGETHTGVIGALTIHDNRGLHRAGQYIMPFELTLTRK